MIVLGLVVLLLGKKVAVRPFQELIHVLKIQVVFLMGFITDCLGVARERLQNRAFHQNDPFFVVRHRLRRRRFSFFNIRDLPIVPVQQKVRFACVFVAFCKLHVEAFARHANRLAECIICRCGLKVSVHGCRK